MAYCIHTLVQRMKPAGLEQSMNRARTEAAVDELPMRDYAVLARG
jgi:hypothetical protein